MVNDYPNARDCPHGHLRRACPICEADARLAELQEAVRWERECDSAWDSDNLPLKAPALYELFATYEAARAAVDAMVGEG